MKILAPTRKAEKRRNFLDEPHTVVGGRELSAGCDRAHDPGFVPPKFTVEEATRRFNTGPVLGAAA